MKNATVTNIRIARSFSTLLMLAFMAGVLLAGCGNEFGIKGQKTAKTSPNNESTDTSYDEGSQLGASKSASRTADQIKFGGGAIRTSSASPSFKMVSGVGVQ